MRRTIRVISGLVVGAALGLAWIAPAQAASADSVDVTAKLTRDGVLTVTQTFTLPSGITDVADLTQSIPSSMDRDGRHYAFDVTDVTVQADGTAVTPDLTRQSGATLLSIPLGTATEFIVNYTVSGTTTTAVDGKVDFTWPVLGALNISAIKITGSVELPPGAVNYDCSAGVAGALTTCSTYGAGTHGSTTLEFTQSSLLAGQIVQAEVIFPAGMVTTTERWSPVWTLGRALSPGGTQIGSLVLVLVVGGLLLFAAWRKIRTAGYRGLPVAVAAFDSDKDGKLRFDTDPDARPGMVGTLVDSSVDPADILATILDLAVRGHVRITEVETSRYATADWTFTRLAVDPAADSQLKPYESALLDVLTADEAKVSALSGSVRPAIGAVQHALYQEVLSAGWFSRLPSKKSPTVRWGWIGLAADVLATCALLAFTTFGLVGLGLIAVAIVAIMLAHQAHPVTPKGAAVYAGLADLSKQLHDRSGEDIEAADRYDQISRILPYSVVLGGWDHWLAAMVAADTDAETDPLDLPWYRAPQDWHMSDLPHSLDSFITVVTGRLFTRA